MKICKDCGREFKATGRNHIRCSDCKRIEERKQALVYSRKLSLRKFYNLTVEQYNLMFDKQQGCCAICGTHQSLLKKTLAVDHCHTTGQIRGLLCSKCNLLIGYANDNLVILASAINYLKK